MKKIIQKTLLFVIALVFQHAAHAQQHRQFVIRGQVIDRDDSELLLAEPFGRFDKQHDSVRIRDGAFEHTFEGEPESVRKLIFGSELARGAFRSIDFFLDRDTIDFLLYPTERFNENRISGGQLNDELWAFNTSFVNAFDARFSLLYATRDSLYKAGNFYTERYSAMMEELNSADSDRRVVLFRQRDSLENAKLDLTEDGNRLRDVIAALQQETVTWRYDYIAERPSPVSLFLLVTDLYYQRENPAIVQAIAAIYPDYAAHFPNHPYTSALEEMLRGVLGVVVGGHIIDFEAPDLADAYHRLSDLLTEKVLLIDFWGSWCGPCIAKTRTMVPVYEAYHGKGFGIVGIAREFGDTHALRARLEQEAFTWVNLVELDDQQGIWKKYGMSNAAGLMLLNDQQGEILAINPTADEVRQLLDQLL